MLIVGGFGPELLVVIHTFPGLHDTFGWLVDLVYVVTRPIRLIPVGAPHAFDLICWLQPLFPRLHTAVTFTLLRLRYALVTLVAFCALAFTASWLLPYGGVATVGL